MLETVQTSNLNYGQIQGSGPRAVLIVDDEVGAAEELAEALFELGHPSYIATCRESAKKTLGQHPEIGTIVSDFYLCGSGNSRGNGISLIEELRAEFPERNLDVIIVSGDHDLLAECTLLGPLKFLTKPVAPESLSAMFEGSTPEFGEFKDPDQKVVELHRLVECQSQAISQLTAAIRAYENNARKIHDRLGRISSAAALVNDRLRTDRGDVIDIAKYISGQSAATLQLVRKPIGEVK